ncbi:ABC transporter permease [Arthrobacter sp. GMC3]|uniref:ABC transporter permease n=1 Tax=Arthrobacter sp. GMC3 TaxID=2058894 RepID=UPI000CE54C26|nr:ABC transporter permease [Arthrobacter sp. GMC3]
MRLVAGLGARFAGLLFVFLGVTLAIYLLVFALPGDPIRALGGDRPLPANVVETLREKYNLNAPLWKQYMDYVLGLFRGDFGLDFRGRSVSDQMAARWPVTIALALTAWAIELVVGIFLGVLAALKAGTAIDKAVLWSTIIFGAVPVFVLAVTAQLVLGARLKLFPVAGIEAGWPMSYMLPALVLAVFGLAAISRLMRDSVIDNLRADYVRTARVKGLSRQRIVGVHVMRNSMVPAVTYLATDLGSLLGSTIVVEGVFNLPGVGSLLFDAIRAHEGTTIVGVSVALILIFLITSLVVDALHYLLDPRIR